MRTLAWMLAFMNIAHSIEVFGHRGNRSRLPENTLPSFLSAIEAGATGLELDLLITRDAQVVIHHDYTVNLSLCSHNDGTPLSSSPPIFTLALHEIKNLDCGRKTNPRFPNQQPLPNTQIPTLRELFELLRPYPHILIDLELKCQPPLTPSAQEFAFLVVSEARGRNVLYSSFNPDVLFAVRRLDPSARILYLFADDAAIDTSKYTTSTGLAAHLEIAKLLHAEALGPEESTLTPSLMDQLRAFRVIPWTVNDPARWQELLSLGVSGIITDYPAELTQFLKNPDANH